MIKHDHAERNGTTCASCDNANRSDVGLAGPDRHPIPGKAEGPEVSPGAFALFVGVRCRTGEVYANAVAPAIQVRLRDATEQ